MEKIKEEKISVSFQSYLEDYLVTGERTVCPKCGRTWAICAGAPNEYALITVNDKEEYIAAKCVNFSDTDLEWHFKGEAKIVGYNHLSIYSCTCGFPVKTVVLLGIDAPGSMERELGIEYNAESAYEITELVDNRR